MVLISGYEEKVVFCFLIIIYVKEEDAESVTRPLPLVFFEPSVPRDSSSHGNHGSLGPGSSTAWQMCCLTLPEVML